MRISITTFYNVRFLKPSQIPISTAVWDPKWYHDNQRSNYWFVDKRGVINGLREPRLSPFSLDSEAMCKNVCPHKNSLPECPFRVKYSEYLDTVDFDSLLSDFRKVQAKASMILQLAESPEIVLLVYEKPDNACSERDALRNYFGKNGFELPELEFNKQESLL